LPKPENQDETTGFSVMVVVVVAWGVQDAAS